VGCRRSWKTTAEESDTTRAMGLSGTCASGAYWQSTAHNKTQKVVAVMWGDLSAVDSKHKYVWVLFVFEESVLGERTPIACCKEDNRNDWKKKENFFFLFSARSVRALSAPVSRSQLRNVKHMYAVDYKSMIRGCRTLLVMNSVNPLLNPLLDIWIMSESRHSMYRVP
jgi:hypothetical protein